MHAKWQLKTARQGVTLLAANLNDYFQRLSLHLAWLGCSVELIHYKRSMHARKVSQQNSKMSSSVTNSVGHRFCVGYSTSAFSRKAVRWGLFVVFVYHPRIQR